MVDPKKMDAWVNRGQKGMGAVDDAPEEDSDMEESTPSPEGEMEGLEKYASMMELLEHAAETIEEHCEGLDYDNLSDVAEPLDDESAALIQECIDSLDENLVNMMRKDMREISVDDAMMIANHLEEDGYITDPESVGMWLFRAGQVL